MSKTLKQIISIKHKIIHSVNDTYMTENDYIECFREWLLQKCQRKFDCNTSEKYYTEKFIDELLDELHFSGKPTVEKKSFLKRRATVL